MQGAQVQSLVRKLRSCMPHSLAKKKERVSRKSELLNGGGAIHTPVSCLSQKAAMLRLETGRKSRGGWMQCPLKELIALSLLNSLNPRICNHPTPHLQFYPLSASCPPPFFPTECARVFHTGGARLVLCGKNWERLQSLYDALISVADPSKVRPSGSQHGQPLGTLSLHACHRAALPEIWW